MERTLTQVLWRPPVIAVALLGLAWGSSALLALPRLVPAGLWPLGVVLLVVGFLLALPALLVFHLRRTTHDPHGVPSALVTEGLYRFTRNPMYLGVTSALTGIGLWVGTLPFLLVPTAFWFLVRGFFVPGEERRLDDLFGDAYRAYRERVRRWL